LWGGGAKTERREILEIEDRLIIPVVLLSTYPGKTVSMLLCSACTKASPILKDKSSCLADSY
jgi:hypothetical protein